MPGRDGTGPFGGSGRFNGRSINEKYNSGSGWICRRSLYDVMVPSESRKKMLERQMEIIKKELDKL